MDQQQPTYRLSAEALNLLREYHRAAQEAAARREAFIQGVLGALGIDARQLAGIDITTGEIRLRAPEGPVPVATDQHESQEAT